MPQQYLSNQQLAEQQARMKEKIKENKLRAQRRGILREEKEGGPNRVDSRQQAGATQNGSKQLPGVAAIVNGRQITLAQLADECITRHGSEVLDGEVNRKILQQELNRKRSQIDDHGD